jgi:hypothetical protein
VGSPARFGSYRTPELPPPRVGVSHGRQRSREPPSPLLPSALGFPLGVTGACGEEGKAAAETAAEEGQ